MRVVLIVVVLFIGVMMPFACLRIDPQGQD